MRSSGRIERRVALRKAEGRALLIFYITAGDPTIEASVNVMHALVHGGTDLIELGYPFCDPILDGPVIRLANRRALDAGGSLDQSLAIVRQFRERDGDTPIVLMGYANPILSRGSEVFDLIAEAGVDGLIIPDLPLREARSELADIAAAGLRLVPLVPPTDAADLDLLSLDGIGGFLYCINQAGPTGSAPTGEIAITDHVASCRRLSTLPVGVGFGIKTPESAARIAAEADAVIIGSALVECLATVAEQGAGVDAIASEALATAASFRRAIDYGRSSSR